MQMFFSSPRNRPDVHVALLEKLKCTILFAPDLESDMAMTKSVLERRSMETYILPSLDFFLADKYVKQHPYNKTFDAARHDPYVVMHSSGSTGTPKILVLRQGWAAAHDAFQLFPSLGETPWFGSTWTGKRILTNFPWVHASGACILASGVYNDFVSVIPASWPLKGADANKLHLHGNVQSACYSPSVLVDIARDPTMLKNMSNLESVAYSGGILPREAGDAISKYTSLFGMMGSTETGLLPTEIPPPDLWSYYRFNENLGHKFRHYSDDMYELMVRREKAKENFQAVFYTFLDDEIYSTRDLYIEHPTRKGWWRSSGRIDDVIIMADAKKLNTIPYEAVIEQIPSVETALICGSGRSRPAVLIQPSRWPQSVGEENELVEAVGRQFEKANNAGPVYGCLIKELIVMAKQSKPMIRAAAKDTVQRKKSLDLYEEEIDETYRRAEKLGLLYGAIMEKGGLI
jgi:acyl-coenzyme A synthetase/AMP-(fatty) acid ligase